jgi:hypothetical protein
MKLLSKPEMKKVNYFSVVLEINSKQSCYIATDPDGKVFAYYQDEAPLRLSMYWFGAGGDGVYLGTVDLEGMHWKDTLMEVK